MNFQTNISLKALNTFGIDVKADYFTVFKNENELKELAATRFFDEQYNGNGICILGGGSNILFTHHVKQLVCKNEISGIEKIREDNEHVYIRVGAGEVWHKFVLYCLENNYAGVENLALIPGSVGASPMQNIGAYGVEIKDVFHSLEAFHLHDKTMVSFSKNDCVFGYRESVFKNKYKGSFAITAVTYQLKKQPVFHTTYGAIQQELEAMKISSLSIQSIAQAVINIRSSKLPDPAQIGNAGSFFKNPEIDNLHYEQLKTAFPSIVGYPLENGKVKLAAGWLIEQCGWKGFRRGDAGCHAKQALVLVNYGNAQGQEIYDLSTEILASVKEKFNVLLEREVNIL